MPLKCGLTPVDEAYEKVRDSSRTLARGGILVTGTTDEVAGSMSNFGDEGNFGKGKPVDG